MSAAVCPNCNATLPPQELAEGWCESCGKKIPAWIRGDLPAWLPQESRPIPMGFHLRPSVKGLSLAPRWARLAAVLIDVVLLGLVVLPGAVLMDTRDENGYFSLMDTGMLLLLLGAGLLTLVQYVLLSWNGQTVGKKVLRVRIVREKDGGKAGFVHAVLLRNIVPGMISGIPGLGPLFALVDVLFIFADDCRCLHDHIAGTRVIGA